MEDTKIKQIIEALLLAAGKPMTLDKMLEVFEEHERPERDALKTILQEIEDSCTDRGFELKKVASGYRFQVRQELSDWVGRLWEEKPQRYSRALLETLAIIAYRQPITRGDIEKIRGVAVSSSIIRTMLERDWIRVVGHRDVPGRPAMYASTREFLDYFNLESLNDLPALTEIRDMEGLNQELTVEEEKPGGNVIEFPGETEVDEVHVPDEEELAAAAIGTRSMDEILGIEPEETADDGDEQENADAEKVERDQAEADTGPEQDQADEHADPVAEDSATNDDEDDSQDSESDEQQYNS
ncbi:MAG: SMC-Scp complex subunit ScpB [Gammaproteobacteria bacterium]|nr:SMC-Scp complex subunit ScpB [Gammaproteobacteria bacterium]MAY02749.1 SMC-Scp complex subunit ScpB [Gammaproteobacteria bacterium]|tara:strand:+ start:27974 stop:28867 length:894 start_codon:yes stop_codon:yes gene_type:complete